MSDSTPYTALHDPATDPAPWVPSLDMALDLARDELAKAAAANIHDRDAMILAAVGLEMRLRQLVGAFDKKAGHGAPSTGETA